MTRPRKRRKAETWWVVVAPDGTRLPWTGRFLEEEVRSVPESYRLGYTVERIRVTRASR